MRHVIDELTEPAAHLAIDEALLLQADEGTSTEALRVWEFSQVVVVAGRATRVDDEIDLEFCQSRGVPVLRRCSGGASVLGGPGCLMYSLILSFEAAAELKKIDVAHQHVMQRVLRALQQQLPAAMLQGTCDLTWNSRKFSGNSLRIAREHLLYHGTILYDFDLPLITSCLKQPPRQPEYRQARDHESFITNVPIDPGKFAADLCARFNVTGQSDAESLQGRIRQLRKERYDARSWHFRH
jgi:lipoate-protein ligase A